MGRRKPGKRRGLHRRVTVPTINSQAAHVVLVRERHRLGANHTHLGLVRRLEKEVAQEQKRRAQSRPRRRSSNATACWHSDEISVASNPLAFWRSRHPGAAPGPIQALRMCMNQAAFNTRSGIRWNCSRRNCRSARIVSRCWNGQIKCRRLDLQSARNSRESAQRLQFVQAPTPWFFYPPQIRGRTW